MERILKEADKKMEEVVSSLKHEFATIRTGRASPGLLEHIKVEYYGTYVPLNQLANISIPEARLININVWDKDAVKSVSKAIMNTNLGIMPAVDGNTIRLQIPPLTDERRKVLDKMVKQIAEEKKASIRKIRHDAYHKIDQQKKNKEIGEDDAFRLKDEVQRITDSYIEKIDVVLSEKEKEIMER
ncbi:TPA: ribosome recycling factor [bacterium]|nr:ribosome recycling factor [bacterium]